MEFNILAESDRDSLSPRKDGEISVEKLVN
jgi:hypothetical protein